MLMKHVFFSLSLIMVGFAGSLCAMDVFCEPGVVKLSGTPKEYADLGKELKDYYARALAYGSGHAAAVDFAVSKYFMKLEWSDKESGCRAQYWKNEYEQVLLAYGMISFCELRLNDRGSCDLFEPLGDNDDVLYEILGRLKEMIYEKLRKFSPKGKAE